MNAPAPKPGLVIVDKPAGMTSHDVVSKLRRAFSTRKVGHAGTLDPMATGVLVIGIERGTRFLAHMVASTKAYDATIRLGAATSTDAIKRKLVAHLPGFTTAQPPPGKRASGPQMPMLRPPVLRIWLPTSRQSIQRANS